jgi:hypothetical protein
MFLHRFSINLAVIQKIAVWIFTAMKASGFVNAYNVYWLCEKVNKRLCFIESKEYKYYDYLIAAT